MREVHYSQDGKLISHILLPKKNECEFVVQSKNVIGSITVENIKTAYSFNRQKVKTIDFYYDATAEYPDSDIMLRAGIGTENYPFGLKDFADRGRLPENLRCAINTFCQCSGVYVRLFCRGDLPQVISGFVDNLLVVPWGNQIFYIESDTDIWGTFVGAKIEVADAVDFFAEGFVDCEVSIHSKDYISIHRCAYNSSFLGIEQSTESVLRHTGGSDSAAANCSFSNISEISIAWGHSIKAESCSKTRIYYCVDSTVVSNSGSGMIFTNLCIDSEFTLRFIAEGFSPVCSVYTAYNCVFNHSIEGWFGDVELHSYSNLFEDCTFNIDLNTTASPDNYSYDSFAHMTVLYNADAKNCEFNISGKIDLTKDCESFSTTLSCVEYSDYANVTANFDVNVVMPNDDPTIYTSFRKRIKMCVDADNNSGCQRCMLYERLYDGTIISKTDCQEV